MRHLKLLGVMLVAMFTLGVTALGMTATSAFALPEISVLPTENYPLFLNFADNEETPTGLETTGGGLLEGKGVLLLMELSAKGSLGKFKTDFLNVTSFKSTTKCSSTGDAAGVVLVTGEWHVVPITDKTGELTNGIAFLLGSLVIVTCGTTKIDIKGCALASLDATENLVDLTATGGALATDGLGHNRLTQFLNNKLEAVECKLQTEILNTKVSRQGAESVNEGKLITLTIETGSTGKMFEFDGL